MRDTPSRRASGLWYFINNFEGQACSNMFEQNTPSNELSGKAITVASPRANPGMGG